MGENSAQKTSFFTRIKDFFKSIKGEFKKIVWPGKKSVLRSTGIVVAYCILIGVVVYVLDFVFAWLFNLVVGLL